MGFGGWGGPGHYVVTPLQLELRLSWAVAICSEFKGWILCIHMTKYSYRDISKRQKAKELVFYIFVCFWFSYETGIFPTFMQYANICAIYKGRGEVSSLDTWHKAEICIPPCWWCEDQFCPNGRIKGGGWRFVFGRTQWLYEIEKISWNPMTIFEKFQISEHRKDPEPFFGPRQQLKLL